MSWNWMSGRRRDDYLFSDGDLGESLRQHVENAVRSVDQIPEQQFKECRKLCGDCKKQLVDFLVKDIEGFNKRLKASNPEKCLLKNK